MGHNRITDSISNPGLQQLERLNSLKRQELAREQLNDE